MDVQYCNDIRSIAQSLNRIANLMEAAEKRERDTDNVWMSLVDERLPEIKKELEEETDD